jgi:hypothetical protein
VIKLVPDEEARKFLNSVPYPEHVPENLPLNSEHSAIIGIYNPDLVGVFPVQKRGKHLEIHAAFLPKFRGAFAVNSAKQVFEWIWTNTDYRRITADISEPHIQNFAERCGMTKQDKYYEVLRWADL